MKAYIATKLDNHAAHNALRDAIGEFCEITYDWTVHGSVKEHGLDRVREVAMLEAEGVKEADVVIVLWPGGRGTHVELGMALALGKPVLMFSDVENHHLPTPETCAFYHHPRVRLFDDVNELLAALRAMRRRLAE